MQDDHAEKSVMDLIAGQCEQRVYPVGRLDKSTMGVLCLQMTGSLQKNWHILLTIVKKYIRPGWIRIWKADMDQLVNGVELEDGPMHVDMISAILITMKKLVLRSIPVKPCCTPFVWSVGVQGKKTGPCIFCRYDEKESQTRPMAFLTGRDQYAEDGILNNLLMTHKAGL